MGQDAEEVAQVGVGVELVQASRCAQCRGPLAVNGFPAENAVEVCPLARHSATRLAHSSRLVRPSRLGAVAEPHQPGSVQRIRASAPGGYGAVAPWCWPATPA